MKLIVLKLDRERELRYGFKALKLLKEKFGNKSLAEMMDLQVDEIPQLIWAGLKLEDKALTVEMVEDLLDQAITIEKTYTIIEVTSMGLEALAIQMGVDLKKLTADDLKKKIPAPEELQAGVVALIEEVGEEELKKAVIATVEHAAKQRVKKKKKQPKRTTVSTKKQKK